MSTKIKWWGYKHQSGTLHTKRYFDRLDITEAQESPFVDSVFGPFEADSADHARQIVRKHFNE